MAVKFYFIDKILFIIIIYYLFIYYYYLLLFILFYFIFYRQHFPNFVILSQILLPWQQRSAGGKYK